MGPPSYSLESVTFHYALETLSFGSPDDIHEHPLCKDVRNSQLVAKLQFLLKVGLELYKLLLRRNAGFVKVTFKRLGSPFFLFFVIGKLHSGITVFFNRAELRNNTRTSLNDGAWKIFSIGTENGSHSDFLSN